MRGLDRSSDGDIVEQAGLAGVLDRRPGELSLAQRQLLAITAAALGPPRVIIADEPTASLDPTTSRRVAELLAQCAAHGATVVAASHDPTLFDTAETILHIRAGTLAFRAQRPGGETLAVVDRGGRIHLPEASAARLGSLAHIEDNGTTITITPT